MYIHIYIYTYIYIYIYRDRKREREREREIGADEGGRRQQLSALAPRGVPTERVTGSWLPHAAPRLPQDLACKCCCNYPTLDQWQRWLEPPSLGHGFIVYRVSPNMLEHIAKKPESQRNAGSLRKVKNNQAYYWRKSPVETMAMSPRQSEVPKCLDPGFLIARVLTT